VQIDVARGLVSRDGAQRYGVVLDQSGAIDIAATEKLRDQMRGDRGETGLFNFGGTIEEIKARSLEETHLPAPVAPNA